MILLCNTRSRRKMAHSVELLLLCFSRQQFFDNVVTRRVVCMRRGAPSCTNRYPSPSLWSGPIWVRPEFSPKKIRRRCHAEFPNKAEIRFDFAAVPPHISLIKRPKGGGLRCSISRLQSRLVARRFWQVASTTTPNAQLRVQGRVQSLPVQLAATCLSGLALVPQLVRSATTQAFAEPDLTFASGPFAGGCTHHL